MLGITGINNLTQKKALLVALIVNVFIVLLCFLLFYPSFETNDDSGIIAIASGMRGERDAHLVHSNYLLGKVLVTLYTLSPEVQWWSLLQLFFLFSSFVLITFVFVRDNFSAGKLILITAIVFFFSYDGYTRIQYTKTAGILSAVGLFVMFYGTLQKNTSKILVFLGMLVAVIGSFYRTQEFLAITAVFSSMAIYLIIYFIENSEEAAKRIVSAAAIGFVLLMVVGGLRMYDRNQYKSPEWSSYLEFDKYRTKVIDYGVPDYENHKEEYNAIGIDKTAYNLMKKWTFQDSEKFTANTFRQIAEFRDKKSVNADFFIGFVKKYVKGLLNEWTALCFLAVACGWIIIGNHRARNLISLIVLLAIITLLNFYLYYAGRFMVHRVDAGIWFSAVLITLYQIFGDRLNGTESVNENYGIEAKSIKRLIPFAISALIVMIFVINVPWQQNCKATVNLDTAKMLIERNSIERISNDKKHLYLTKVGALKFSEAYGVFDPIPYRIADNIYPLGGWGAATPVYTDVLTRYNVDNPFRDLIGNSNVYLVDNDIDKTLAYIRKWYKHDAKAELSGTINKQKVYRII